MQARSAADVSYVGLLGDVVRALAGEETLSALLQRCAQAVVDHLDAAFARVWLLDEDRCTLTLHASAGLYTHLDGPHGRIPVGAFKIGRIAEQRSPHLTNDVPNDPDVSDKEWAAQEGMVAFAGYPLLVGSRLVGVMGLFARRPLPDSTLDVLASVADSLALGIVRKTAEEQRKVDRHVIDTLNQVGAALARELDVERLVQAVTEAGTTLSGAAFGAFFYNVVDDQGESYVLYTLSGAPASAFEGFGLPRNTAVFEPTFNATGVLRSPDITADPRYGQNPPHHGMPRGHLPVRSYLAVPVVARDGEVLGGLFFGHPEPDVFTETSERLVVGIASHAAVAIENARLYERERTAAITLQRSLLPTSLPVVAGATLTGSYLPASHHNEIGGDWYDGLALPDGRVVLAVGDAGGHDLAAAAVMGQFRHTVRLASLDATGPAEALRRVDRYANLADSGFATILNACYDPATRELALASAGHPPPLLLRPSGAVEVIDVDPMPAVGYGLLEDAEGPGAVVVLEPGSSVLMYTDGLVERRGEGWDTGLDRLRRAAEAGAMLEPAALCKHLVAELVGEQHQADDIALLLLTVDGAGD